MINTVSAHMRAVANFERSTADGEFARWAFDSPSWSYSRFIVALNKLYGFDRHICVVMEGNRIYLVKNENENMKETQTAMKYLVCRTQALRTNGRSEQMGSSMFPIVVESFHYDAEAIVRQACGTISEGYVGMHEYVVVPMEQATVVSFRPRAQYDVSVRGYND